MRSDLLGVVFLGCLAVAGISLLSLGLTLGITRPHFGDHPASLWGSPGLNKR